MTFNELKASGLYFVTKNTAFTMKYLELCYLRLLRAKTSPGQEAAVRHLFHVNDKEMFWGHSSFRDHLLHALEGYAVARRKPDEVIEFNVDFPAKHVVKMTNPLLLFPPSAPVDAVAFDGHFGVHRLLLASVEPPRQIERPPHETCVRIRKIMSVQEKRFCPPSPTRSHCWMAVCGEPYDWESLGSL